jgi:hypothetical protein
VHLKTSNPIESTFFPVRRRGRVTKAQVRGRQGWRWRSSSSSRRKTADGASTGHASSHSYEQARHIPKGVLMEKSPEDRVAA